MPPLSSLITVACVSQASAASYRAEYIVAYVNFSLVVRICLCSPEVVLQLLQTEKLLKTKNTIKSAELFCAYPEHEEALLSSCKTKYFCTCTALYNRTCKC